MSRIILRGSYTLFTEAGSPCEVKPELIDELSPVSAFHGWHYRLAVMQHLCGFLAFQTLILTCAGQALCHWAIPPALSPHFNTHIESLWLTDALASLRAGDRNQ